ncbi:unnamed protein product [Sphenostylis stenocarpa]|uniref:Uncharacterized protein n=1 Tax=Sphenostylis stenocarpa TaxID=92480 RepID=A0AA86T6B3_9FABA|nr:unnamed protein product [Sphenostylis stenocarpa]
MSKCIQKATGLRNSKSGYESLVEAATMASQNFSPTQQHQVVIHALHTAFPKPMLLLFMILFLCYTTNGRCCELSFSIFSFPSPMVGVFHGDTSHLHLLRMMGK